MSANKCVAALCELLVGAAVGWVLGSLLALVFLAAMFVLVPLLLLVVWA